MEFLPSLTVRGGRLRFARVSTAHGACVLRVVVTDRQPEGHLFAPIHWTDATAGMARIGALVAACADPISGQPEMKATPATVTPHAFANEGFLLARRAIDAPGDFWWSRIAIEGGFAWRLASDRPAREWLDLLLPDAGSDRVEFSDPQRNLYRVAGFCEEQAQFALHVAPEAPPWDAAIEIFARRRIEGPARLTLLSGRTAHASGPIVCACFGVGAAQIAGAIKDGCRTPSEIGATLKAGTNCGSCKPEIARMIDGMTSNAR
jgi:assimilatory nitrate reductase catalytic subunit